MMMADIKLIIGAVCAVLGIVNLLVSFWHAWRGELSRFALPLCNFALMGTLIQFGAFG